VDCALLWLPNCSTSKNLFTAFVVDFGRATRERRAGPVRRDGSERLREWRRLLAMGEVANRAELARRVGVSHARVTQALRRP
jgi:hypothetical protein